MCLDVDGFRPSPYRGETNEYNYWNYSGDNCDKSRVVAHPT